MLATFVGLPAAWIYCGPLPTDAQRVVDRLVERVKLRLGWHRSTPPTSWLSSRQELGAARGPLPKPSTVSLAGVQAAGPPAGSQEIVAPQVQQSPARQDPLEPLLAQLRQLGAAEYALESWGSSGQFFRFRCALTLGDSDDHTRHFEAISADPRTSVEQVLEEASRWRTAAGA
jgi:hypothetical protein